MGQFYDEEKIKAMESSAVPPSDPTPASTPGTPPPAGKFYDEAKFNAMEAGSAPTAARTQNLAKFALISLVVIAGIGMIWWKITHNPATMIVDINKASVTEIAYLPDVGPVIAQRIVDARKGKQFQSIDELKKIKGIGEKTFEKIKPRVKVE